jgi:DnaJ-domain-containing protein 1
VDRDRLVLGLAAVFAGLTTLLVVTAFVRQPFLLLVALPFAATTYFLWFHASGRLAERAREQRDAAERAAANGGSAGGRQDPFGRDGDPRERARTNRDAARERARGRRAGPGATGGRAGPRGNRRRGRREGATAGARVDPAGISREEALQTLGVDADADSAEIKRAYREKVKETHPDSATGDEEAFKRVSKAYERLNGS